MVVILTIYSSFLHANVLLSKEPIVIVNNLSSTEIANKFNISLPPNGQLQGLYTFRLTASKVNNIYVINLLEPTVYINSKYTKETCQYKEIMKHEKQHIDTLDNYLRDFSEKIISSDEEFKEEFRNLLDRYDLANVKIDSYENYKNLLANC